MVVYIFNYTSALCISALVPSFAAMWPASFVDQLMFRLRSLGAPKVPCWHVKYMNWRLFTENIFMHDACMHAHMVTFFIIIQSIHAGAILYICNIS